LCAKTAVLKNGLKIGPSRAILSGAEQRDFFPHPQSVNSFPEGIFYEQ